MLHKIETEMLIIVRKEEYKVKAFRGFIHLYYDEGKEKLIAMLGLVFMVHDAGLVLLSYNSSKVDTRLACFT